MKVIQLVSKAVILICLILILCGVGSRSRSSTAFGQTITTSLSKNQTPNIKLKERIVLKEKNADKEHFITVENLKLHYIEAGSGRPVVLIHGNAGSLHDFEFGTLSAMAGSYRTIAFDLPGHGLSERKKETMSIDVQAAILHSALEKLEIRNPVIVGHSWGGGIALAYALQYPSDVAGLVLLAPAAYPDKNGSSRIASLLDIPLLGDLCLAVLKPIVSLKVLKQQLDVAFYPDKVPHDYFKTAKAEWLSRKQIKTYLHDDKELNQGLQALSSKYGSLQMPTVIVTGDSDRMVVPEENAYMLHSTIPQSKLLILQNAGHQIPEMHPEAVLMAVKTALADKTSFASAAAE